MQTPWHAGRHAWIRLWWWPWLLLAAAFVPMFAGASCLPDGDADIAGLQQLVAKDANRAVREAQGMLDTLQHESLTANSYDPLHLASRIAALYAVKAEAYSILELDVNARSAAAPYS